MCAQVGILEDNQRAKERLARWNIAPRLHARERCVLMRADVHPELSQFLQPRGERGVFADPRADRHGVDEEPDHRLRAGDGSAAAGARGTEADILLAGIAAHQNGPRALNERVECHAGFVRERGEFGGAFRRQ